jgi:nucleotide-binding universal stress UspA family protein
MPGGLACRALEEKVIMQIRQILAPTDFSECSAQAVACAYEFAQTFGAELVLLHVIEDLPPYIGFIPPEGAAMLLKDLERRACVELTEVLPGAKAAEVKVSRRVVVGPPPDEIVRFAVAEQVDLIVIATHGRTGFSHLFMGSVAERVLRTAPCPVMTISPMAMTGEHGHAPPLGGPHTAAG